MRSAVNPLRVAILGGGVAALSAAYELSHPRQKGQFSVTIYQMGWRLGGKCSSGRDLDHNMRIKEHGPHIFFGFYDNGFEMMDECYAALQRPASHPFRNFEDALIGSNDCCVMENVGGSWEPWTLPFFALPGKPGAEGAPDPWEVALNAIARLNDHAKTADGVFVAKDVNFQALGTDNAIRTFEALVSEFPDCPVAARIKEQAPYNMTNDVAQRGRLVLADALRRVQTSVAEAEKTAKSIKIRDGKVPHQDALELANHLRCAQQTVKSIQKCLADPTDSIRHWIILADLGLTVLLGATLDELLLPTRETLEAANQFEYCEWLSRFGAMQITIDSAIVRAMYDTVFGYVDGDPAKGRNIEAGSAVRAQLDLVYCRGNLFWKMRAGTGDVIAAPLFEYLSDRIKFEFFCQIERLVPSSDGAIAEVHVVKQAKVSAPPYRPLKECKGIPVWPDRADLTQLVNGQKYANVNFESGSFPENPDRCVLRAGHDFDVIVLAISLGTLPTICKALADVSDDWSKMLQSGKTVATQGLQLWLDKPIEASGWQGPPHPVVTSFEACALDTWLDATHVIEFENWDDQPRPAQMAMICGPSPPSRPKSNDDFFKSCHSLWPNFCVNGIFDRALLRGREFNSDIYPSSRYVQTPPGSSFFRLAPKDSGFTNLVLAGDWTDYGMNLGCFEGAVISGRLAANALGGVPRKILRAQGDTPRTGGGKKYVEHHPPQTLGGPIVFPDVRMWAFFLRGEIDLVTNLCRRFFDIPSAGRVTFSPLSQIVIMAISELTNGYFQDQPQFGRASEREVAFSIPGIYTCRDPTGAITASGPAAFMPYLFVDNPVALMTGREVLGYFKQLGEVGLPGRAGSKEDFFLNVFGAERMDVTAQWGQQRLLTVTARDRTIRTPPRAAYSSAGSEGQFRANLASKFQAALKLVLDSQIPGRTTVALGNFRGILSGSMSQIFLKQFRSESGDDTAAYQAVTMADYQVTRIRSVKPTQSFDIKIHPLESLPIASELGLNPQMTETGIEVDFSMTLGAGRVLWLA